MYLLFFISLLLFPVLSLKPIYLIAEFEYSPINSEISNSALYPECPSGKRQFVIKDQSNFNTDFLSHYPDCVAKLLRVKFNSTTGKVEQLPGIMTESISIFDQSFFSKAFGSIFSKIKEFGYQKNNNLFSVGYNHFLHPVTSYSVFHKLKNKIEQVYTQTGEKSIFITLNQSSNFISMFLSNYSKSEWVRQYIDSVIFISPTFAGLPSLSYLYSQNLLPFISNTEFKKSIMRMPGLHMLLPNYVVYENFSFDGKFKNHKVSDSFKILKEIGKVDDESEKIFKVTVEKYLKTAIPEPPIPSIIIINEKTAKSSINATISIDGANKYDESVLISSQHACSTWKSVKCIKSSRLSQSVFECISGRLSQTSRFLIEGKSDTELVKSSDYFNGTGVEGKYANSDYVTSHTVGTSDFTYSGPEGKSGHLLSHAFDGRSNTYYLSSIVSNETHNSTIEIAFKEPFALEAFLYTACYGFGVGSTKTFHGFPTLLYVYTSLDGSSYELVGIYKTEPIYPPLSYQFVFPRIITCDKLKIEFVEVTNQVVVSGEEPAKNLIITGLTFIRHLFISGEDIYSNDGYMRVHSISTSEFTFSGSEGMSSYPISNAFDGDSATYYIANVANSDTHKNFIEISFQKTETLELFLYDPVIIQGVFQGYPTTINIYTSVGNDPYSFQMKISGPYDPKWKRVCFKFKELITCDKLKIEFVEVTHQTIVGNSTNPSISNLYFIRYMNDIEYTNVDIFLSSSAYIQTYMIDSSKFDYSGDEGQVGYNLSYAFDNKISTYYMPALYNNNSYCNEIVINFKETVSLTDIIYDLTYLTKNNTRKYMGYPSEVNIYKSLGNEQFTLCQIFVGTPVSPMSKIQFHFQTTVVCDNLKIEFVNVLDQVNPIEGNAYLCITNLFFISEHESDVVPISGASEDYLNDSYVNSIKVNNSEFTFTIDKAAENYPESNIFDGDSLSYYASADPVNFTHHCTLEISFSKTVFLDAFLYDAEYYTKTSNIRLFASFPTGVKVYSSMNNDPYELNTFFVGEPSYPMTRIQFVFPSFIQCDKLKLEFMCVTKKEKIGLENTLVIGELYFIKTQIPATPTPTATVTVTPISTPVHSISPTQEMMPTQIPITDVCQEGSHCRYEGDANHPVSVTINMTTFSSIQSDENGGALLLKNAGLACTSISFSNCRTNSGSSEGHASGGGGGIYIRNDIEMDNSISLKYVNFSNCKAGYGGAVFIYSISIESKISITDCLFSSNQATVSSSQSSELSHESGGSAIFITSKSSYINDCIFFKNIGDNQLKIENDFSQSEESLLLNAKTTNVVRFCKFNIERYSKSSIFYLAGNNGVSCQIMNSVFIGDLNPGSFHITGQALTDKSPRLVIVRCKFSSEYSNAFDSRNDKEYIFIQLEKQTFNYEEEEEEEDSGGSLDAIDYVLIAVVPVLVIIVIVVIKKQCDLIKMGKEVKE